MSIHNIKIKNFGNKVNLLLRTGAKDIPTASELSRRLGISPSALSRMTTGARSIPQRVFSELCKIYDIDESAWYGDLSSFGQALGFTPQKVSMIAGAPVPGIDFSSRITDRRMIADIHEVIRGYWYSYYYSVSRFKEKLVSRDLCIVKDINDDGFIECEVTDNYFKYIGVCFPIKGMLYFILEKDGLFNEIIVYATNLPDRTPPMLNGIILCLSGGVDETTVFPCASKVAFRFIGKGEDVPILFDIGDGSVDQYMRKTIPAYLNPEKDTEPENLEIYHAIDNHIPRDLVPFALCMK